MIVNIHWNTLRARLNVDKADFVNVTSVPSPVGHTMFYLAIPQPSESTVVRVSPKSSYDLATNEAQIELEQILSEKGRKLVVEGA